MADILVEVVEDDLSLIDSVVDIGNLVEENRKEPE